MGNNPTAAGTTKTSDDMTVPLPPLSIPPAPPESPKPIKRTVLDNNPDTFEELNSIFKDLFPRCFEGGRFVFRKTLTSHFQVAHTLNFSSVNPGYVFEATYIGNTQFKECDADPSNFSPDLLTQIFLKEIDDSDVRRNLSYLLTQNTSMSKSLLSPKKLPSLPKKKPAGLPVQGSSAQRENTKDPMDSPPPYPSFAIPGKTDAIKKSKSRRKEFIELVKQMYPVLSGKMDGSGNLHATITHAFTQKIKSKFEIQIQDHKWLATYGGIDYRGSDYTASLTVRKEDITKESGILNAQFVKKVWPSFSVGAELAWLYSSKQRCFDVSVATKLTGDKWTFSGLVGPLDGKVRCCYHHEITETLDVGTEIVSNIAKGESVCKLGYRIKIPGTYTEFKGSIDTNLGIEAFMGIPLLPFPFTFALSGKAKFDNFQRTHYQFGIGLFIETSS